MEVIENKTDAEKVIVYTGQISEEQIEALKRKHGIVLTLEVKANDEGTEIALAYLKRPDRLLLGAYFNKNKINQISAKEMLLTGCWLDGDKRIQTDDDLFLSACPSLEYFFDIRESSLKKN
jgi:hypothetical protein